MAKKIRCFADIPESPIKNMVGDLLDEAKNRGVVSASGLYKDLVSAHGLTRGEAAALSSYFQICYSDTPTRKKNPVAPASAPNLDDINNTLNEYGASLEALSNGTFSLVKGTKRMSVIITFRKGRMRIEGEIGNLLFTGAPTGRAIENFVTNFWYWDKVRRTNPVPESSRAHELRHGARTAENLYTAFTGHEAGEKVMIDKPVMPDVLSVIGDIDGVLYTTIRDGKVEKYIHKFKKNSRPLFCVAPDGRSIFMIGGSYEFGERGIIDK